MVANMPVASLYLLLVGGLATACAMAAWRREWAWVLALALPMLLATGHAGMPMPILGWGCALYVVALSVFVGVWVVRATGMVGVGLLGAVLLAGFSSMPAAASLGGFAPLSLDSLPGFGVRLAAMLDTLTAD